MKNIIEVENLTKKFGSFIALDNISFEGKEGEVLGFLGPNGAGKTTTIKILTGFMPATLGTARIDGYDIFYDSFNVREIIGYLPEIPPLYPDMTVKSFLTFVAELKHVPQKQVSNNVNKVMELCGLMEMKSRLIYKLSRGYKQRVGIAQAIIHDPKVIILDEPTVGLDPNQVVEIRNLITELAENRTIMLSTHILSEAETLCKNIIIIDNGKILKKGSMEDFQDKQIVKLSLDKVDDERLKIISSIVGVNSVSIQDNNILSLYCENETAVKSEIIKLSANNNWNILELSTEKVHLEEVFQRLTSKNKG